MGNVEDKIDTVAAPPAPRFLEASRVWVQHGQQHAIILTAKALARGIFYDVLLDNGIEDFFVESALVLAST